MRDDLGILVPYISQEELEKAKKRFMLHPETNTMILQSLMEHNGRCFVRGCKVCVLKVFKDMDTCMVPKAYKLAKLLVENEIFGNLQLEPGPGRCVSVWED